MKAYRDPLGYHTYIDNSELERFRNQSSLGSQLEDSETEKILGKLSLKKGQTTDTAINKLNGDITLTISKIGSQQLEEKGFFDSGLNGRGEVPFNFHVVVTDFRKNNH